MAFILVMLSMLANIKRAETEELSAAPIRLAWGEFDPAVAAPDAGIADEWRVDSSRSAGDVYMIVQFDGPLMPDARDSLIAQGITFHDYIPHYSYIVRASAEARASMSRASNIRWMGEFEPAYRVEPGLMGAFENALASRSNPTIDMIVLAFTDADVAAISAAVEAAGGEVVEARSDEWKNKFNIRIPLQNLPAVAGITGVNWVEATPEFDTFNGTATQITDIVSVWDHVATTGYYGSGQVVAVADTGLDQGSVDAASLHDDFEDGAGSARVLAIYDRVGDGSYDVNGHGTHVAGTVLGNGLRDGSTPATHAYTGTSAGVAPEASLVFQAIGRDDGLLAGIPFFLSWMFDEAHQNLSGGSVPAYIHSNSWGIPYSAGVYSTYSRDVDEYMWNNQDFLVLFAAGNNAADTSGNPQSMTVTAPSTAKNTLTVGATWNTPSDPNQMTAYSGRGPTRDGRIKPDIVAPGSFIQSTASQQIYGSDYILSSGTSMATPHVAGAAALMREYFTREGETPSAALIKAALTNGAFDMGTDPASNVNVARPTNDAGWGRLDLGYTFGVSTTASMQWWDGLGTGDHYAAPLSTGDVITYPMTVLGTGEPLRVTLSWTDYPGSTFANGGLVNDLNLHVVAPDGTIHYPANANNGGLGGNYDHVNNQVGIDVAVPQAGEYKVVVTGHNVTQSTQPYALIARADFTGDPNRCSLDIPSIGTYTFCSTGLTLEITSEDVDRISVQLFTEQPSHALNPAIMVGRYYSLTISGGTNIIANATFSYDESELPLGLMSSESSLNIHHYDDAFWNSYPPNVMDTTNNMLTLNAVLIESGTSDWAFGPDVPTAVTMSVMESNSASYAWHALAAVLCATFLTMFLKDEKMWQ